MLIFWCSPTPHWTCLSRFSLRTLPHCFPSRSHHFPKGRPSADVREITPLHSVNSNFVFGMLRNPRKEVVSFFPEISVNCSRSRCSFRNFEEPSFIKIGAKNNEFDTKFVEICENTCNIFRSSLALSGAEVRKTCRYRKMLQTEHCKNRPLETGELASQSLGV